MTTSNRPLRPRSSFKPRSRERGFIFFVLAAIVVFIVGVVLYVFTAIVPKVPPIDAVLDYKPKIPLRIYTADNVLIGEFGEEHRDFVPIANIPPMMKNAVLAIEDARFYEHGGIDWMGAARAVGSNLRSGFGSGGASTITMQVARNFFLSKEKKLSRKINEIALAYKIEDALTKDQILELYMNQIYLGQRSYGFASAARAYFGKDLDKLSVAETAMLAGLPQNPARNNPAVNPKRAKQRQEQVLRRLHDLQQIDDAQYAKALKEPMRVHSRPQEFGAHAEYVAELFVDRLSRQLRDILGRRIEFLAGVAFDAQRFGQRGGVLRLGDRTQFEQALEDSVLACRRAFRVRYGIGAGRILWQAGQHRRLGQRQLIERLAEVAARSARKTVRALAQVDLVHVQLEDLVLGQRAFDLVGEGDFGQFAREGLFVGEEEVAGDLHRDGGCALAETAAQVGAGCAHRADEVDAAVFIEARVLDREHGAFHHRGDFRDRDEVAVLDAELADQHIVLRVDAQRDLGAVVGDGVDRRHFGADRAPHADRQAARDQQQHSEKDQHVRVRVLHAQQGFSGLLVGRFQCRTLTVKLAADHVVGQDRAIIVRFQRALSFRTCMCDIPAFGSSAAASYARQQGHHAARFKLQTVYSRPCPTG